MRARDQKIILIALLSVFVTAAHAASLDQYGGYTDLPVPGGATGHFRTGKIGNRWVYATPDGNAYWMTGVYYVTGDGHVDEGGKSYDSIFGAKYGTGPIGWPQQNRRLKSWGFNTLGPGTYRMLLPMDYEPEWPGGQQPVKMPFIWGYINPGINGELYGAVKSLYRGMDVAVFGEWAPRGTFPDAFDPKFAPCTANFYANSPDIAYVKNSPYLLGAFGEDTDYLNGFGPGTDFPTDPVQKYHFHLGYLSLVTSPTQATNAYANNVAYADTKVYSKYALRDSLVAKYGTIAALNAAWGSSYTTFDSNGGWPSGSGLMDENGRAGHTWLNNFSFGDSFMPAAIRTDLDNFLYLLAAKYFSADRAAFKAVMPNKLYLGPTNLGGAGWRAPARGPILKAAGEYLDVINIGTDGSQAQLDFVAKWAGDHPIAIWEGTTANANSGRFRYAMEPSTWAVTTQEQRGQIYQRDVNALINGTVTATGNQPFIGLMFWSYLDSMGEQANWGLVSLRDNPYDGKADKVAAGTDAWGYPTGGEEKDYGDFLTAVTQANNGVHAVIAGAPTPTDTTAPGTSILSPTTGSGVSGSVSVAVNATDNVGVNHVELSLDNATIGSLSMPPYNFLVNTTGIADGSHNLVAKAFDDAGNIGTSSVVAVSVLNTPAPPPPASDTTGPSVSFSSPVNGQIVTRKFSVVINASDPSGVQRVELYANGVLKNTDWSSPWSFRLNLPRGKEMMLTAKCYDKIGNMSAASVAVTVR